MAGKLPEIENNLAAIREKREWSAAALAKEVGISRQAIYAIEAGSYVPNTAVSLRLARVLDVALEELFQLSPAPSQRSGDPKATLIPSNPDVREGQAVQLCEIDGRLIAARSEPGDWYLPPSDAVLSSMKLAGGQVNVSLHEKSRQFRNRLLLAGCDPAMTVLARHLQTSGVELVLVHRNSSQALSLLKHGCVHIAGTHLGDAATDKANLPAIIQKFQRSAVAVVSFALWQEGLVTAPGNPKQIRQVEDLARRDIRFVNREAGSGSRLLLDSHLSRLGILAKRVRGYDRYASGHLQAAREVNEGNADCCVATQAAARVFGLPFVPLQTERFDLVIRRDHLTLPAVQTMLNAVTRADFRNELNHNAGYDTSVTGQRVL